MNKANSVNQTGLNRCTIQVLLTAIFFIGVVDHGQAALAESDWYDDPALAAKAKSFRFFDFKNWTTVSPVLIRNHAAVDSIGPHRLVVHTEREVLNADGVTTAGLPYIDLCDGQESCTIEAAEKRRVKVAYRTRFLDFFYFPKPRVAAETMPFEFQLLHTADMDGIAGALVNVKPFSALVHSLQNQFPNHTLTLSSGDNYIPGPRFAAAADESLAGLLGVPGEGRADIAFLNAMGFQAAAVGNHDLDTGTAGFAAIISNESGENGQYVGSRFPYLSSNLDFSLDENLAPLLTADGQAPAAMANGVARYTVIDIAGEKLAVLGATTPKLAEITNTGDIGVLPEDSDDLAALAAQIQQTVDEIKAQGINKIIMLAHMQQIAVEKQLAGLLDGVDIIVAGGSNTLLADADDSLQEGDVAADTYPLQLTSISGEPVLVVNTDGDYKYLGRLVAHFNLQGLVIAERLDERINGAYAANDQVLAQLGNPPVNDQVAQLADALSNVLATRDGNIFGKASVYLDGRRSQVRTQETNLGNLTADANLWTAQQADASVQVSIKNGGGIRDDIGYFAYPPGSTNPNDLVFYPTAPNPAAAKQAGDISQFDIQNSLRFNNGLTLLTVTAEQLLAIFEHGVAATEPGATPGRFPQVSGVKFSFDPGLAAGMRVRTLAILDAMGNVSDVVVSNGELQGNPNREIRIVTLNFLAGGGDGYPFPQDAAADRLDLPGSGLLAEGVADFAEAGSEQDSLAEYLSVVYASIPYNSVETGPDQDERIQNLSEKANDTVLN